MPQLQITLPADGTDADVADYNVALEAIRNLLNSGLDKDNLADNAVIASKILDGAIIAAKIANAAVETAKIQDKAVTTTKMNPNRFYKTSGTGSATRQTVGANAVNDLSGMTHTYTTGATDETIFIWGDAMYENTGGTARLQLIVNGAVVADHYKVAGSWSRPGVFAAFPAVANTTYTIKLVMKSENSGTINLTNAAADEAQGWWPKMMGVAVAR